MKKKKEPVRVQCVYSGEEELGELLMRSFHMFVGREASKRQDVVKE